jgi:hypothetical protein
VLAAVIGYNNMVLLEYALEYYIDVSADIQPHVSAVKFYHDMSLGWE